MHLDTTKAIQRINDAIGFRPDGHPLEGKILLRLMEAQRDLESGKTLPRFMLQEDQTLTLLQGEHTVDLPEGFVREDDDNRLHYTPDDSNFPVYLQPMRYRDAVRWATTSVADTDPARRITPAVYVIRKSTIDFIVEAEADFVLTWNYYKAEPTLDTTNNNGWIENAFEWLVGEAGYRLAGDLRDMAAVELFDRMRQQGRAAILADIYADEDMMGPLQMGAMY